jgi:hypothetical protein
MYVGGHLLAVKLAQNLVHQYSDTAAAGHSHADPPYIYIYVYIYIYICMYIYRGAPASCEARAESSAPVFGPRRGRTFAC